VRKTKALCQQWRTQEAPFYEPAQVIFLLTTNSGQNQQTTVLPRPAALYLNRGSLVFLDGGYGMLVQIAKGF